MNTHLLKSVDFFLTLHLTVHKIVRFYGYLNVLRRFLVIFFSVAMLIGWLLQKYG